MTTQYDVDYFIRKFEAIPDERWCEYDVDVEGAQHCVLGHCGVRCRDDGHYTETRISKALERLCQSQLGEAPDYINDGCDPRYPQPTPKQRILAALADIKRQQEQNNLRQVAEPLRAMNQNRDAQDSGDATPLPHSPSPVTAALAKECVHMWCGGQCLYCCAVQPKEGVAV